MRLYKSVIALLLVFVVASTQIFAADAASGVCISFPQPTAALKKALPGAAKPDLKKVMGIASKYYNMAVSKATGEEKADIKAAVTWKPDFSGKTSNKTLAGKYSEAAAFMTAYTNMKNLYIALNSAVFTLDDQNPVFADNLASAIAGYSEDLTGKQLGLNINNAKSYAADAEAVYQYALALELSGMTIGQDALPIIINYGNLCIDKGSLPTAKTLFDTALRIAPGYLPAMEGMASYWTAKGDKKQAQKALEGAKMSASASKTKEMVDDVKNTKTLVIASDSLATMEGKLNEESKVEPVLATDFYSDLDPAGASNARKFVNNLAANFKFTAPSLTYLTQYSTLQTFDSPDGEVAFEAFQNELNDFEENTVNPMSDKFDQKSSQMQQMYSILTMKPNNYANPSDVLTQQYNILMLQRKINAYGTYFTKVLLDKGDLQKIVGDDEQVLDSKLQKFQNAIDDELEPVGRAYSELSISDEEYERQRHAILKKYYPQMNEVTEKAWLDATTTADSQYARYFKTNLEAMYKDCMKNVMLITDPKRRSLFEDYVKWYVLTNLDMELKGIERAYEIYGISGNYPFIDDYEEAPEKVPTLKDIADQAKAEAKAKADFESKAIPETSQLYQRLDKYSQTFDLLFMHAKWHPCKTEVRFNVKMPGTGTGVEATIKQDHMRNTVTYGGGVTVSTPGDYLSGAIKPAASFSLRGEVTVDGNGNVVGGDFAASGQASLTTGFLKSSMTFESSVMRGNKMSAEVAEIYNEKFMGTPEEISVFQPEKPKKILWKGEHQVGSN